MQVESHQAPGVAPILRWAGSKRWLVRRGLGELIGQVEGRYFEPFLGSATVFSTVRPTAATLSDLNENLVRTYRELQRDASLVAERVQSIALGEEAYYQVRADFPASDQTLAAAQFIYLNTFCYNGLYRVNRAGKFNVPYGRPKTPNTPSLESLVAFGKLLGGDIDLRHVDFREGVTSARSGDTVYLDPPYIAGHRKNGFIDYNSHLFSWNDQLELASLVRDLDRTSVRVVMSNADHPSVRELYKSLQSFEVARHSSMSATPGSRGITQELVITNVSGDSSWLH